MTIASDLRVGKASAAVGFVRSLSDTSQATHTTWPVLCRTATPHDLNKYYKNSFYIF